MTWGRLSCALLLAGLSAACVSHEPPQPTLTLAPATCDGAPNLGAAKALVPNGSKAVHDPTEITAASPCLRDSAGAPRLYAIYRLPQDGAYTLRIASPGVGDVVFAPSISLLDAQGAVLRQVIDDMLTFRGGALSAFVRIRPGEHYALIASDPGKVGKGFSRTGMSTGTTMVPVGGGGFVSVPYSYDNTRDYVFSHTGSVTVTLEPLATAQP